MKYMIVYSLTYTSQWLALPRDERNRFNEEKINPLLAKYADRVSVRFFDAEAFSARCSDFVLFETNDLKHYYFLIEELRDTALFTQGYVRTEDVLMGLERGYIEFEEQKRREPGKS